MLWYGHLHIGWEWTVYNYLWVSLFLSMGGLYLHAVACSGSLKCFSEYYCCCLCYPPFPSLPLTEQSCSHCWATSTFEGFYCCREEAIAIERALVALPETDRWEPGYRWWKEVWEDEKQPKDQRVRVSLDECSLLSSLLTSPVCLPPLYVCFLACP